MEEGFSLNTERDWRRHQRYATSSLTVNNQQQSEESVEMWARTLEYQSVPCACKSQWRQSITHTICKHACNTFTTFIFKFLIQDNSEKIYTESENSLEHHTCKKISL